MRGMQFPPGTGAFILRRTFPARSRRSLASANSRICINTIGAACEGESPPRGSRKCASVPRARGRVDQLRTRKEALALRRDVCCLPPSPTRSPETVAHETRGRRVYALDANVCALRDSRGASRRTCKSAERFGANKQEPETIARQHETRFAENGDSMQA